MTAYFSKLESPRRVKNVEALFKTMSIYLEDPTHNFGVCVGFRVLYHTVREGVSRGFINWRRLTWEYQGLGFRGLGLSVGFC